MREIRPVALAVLVLCVTTAGCAAFGLGGGNSDGVTPEEITAEAESVDSYSLNVTRTLESTGVNETVELSGVVDRTDREARIRRTTDSNLGDGQSKTQYVVGGVEYVDGESGWESAPLEEGSWAEIDRLRGAIRALEDTELERVGTEEIAGTETVIYELDIGIEMQDELVGANESSHVPTVVEEFRYYVSVDPETGTLYRTDLRALVTQGEGNARFAVETTFTDHGESVDVSLPDSAPSGE